MLPANYEEDQEEAARILAPFLIVSNHLLFNFEDEDFKTSLTNAINTLLKAIKLIDFSSLMS